MENSQTPPTQTSPTNPPIQTIPRSEVSKSNILRNTILAVVWLMLVGSIVYILVGNDSVSLKKLSSIVSNPISQPAPTTTPVSKLNPNSTVYSNQTFKYSIDLGGVYSTTNCNPVNCVYFPEHKMYVAALDSAYLMSEQPESKLLTKSYRCDSSSEYLNPTCSVLEVQELVSNSNIKGYLVIQEQSSTSPTGEQVFTESSHVIFPLNKPVTINNITYNELQISLVFSDNTSKLVEIAKTFKYE